jgi:nucleotidyltransferase-like protein/uncharacterized protein DUF4037
MTPPSTLSETRLDREQRDLVAGVAAALAQIPRVVGIVLGGSWASGRARRDSDIDLGVLYEDSDPFEVERVRGWAAEVNDASEPVVSDFYAWGPWVNGGAWLTIGGQRVDLLYRSLEQLERAIADAEAGRYEVHAAQQPPFGFFSATLLGELAVCLPLHDPDGLISRLKRRVAVYPEALRRAVVGDHLWAVEFNLEAFAPRFARRGDAYGTAGCLTRALHGLVLVLFALNRLYPLNDKTSLAEITEFERAPRDFAARAASLCANVGAQPEALGASVELAKLLFCEVADLAGELYRPRYAVPG